MSTIDRYPDTDPAEEVVVRFNFSGDTEAVSAPVIHAYVGWAADTVDATPEAMFAGNPAYTQGANVYQRLVLSGRVHLTDYLLTCLATTAEGEKLMVAAVLPVRSKKEYLA